MFPLAIGEDIHVRALRKRYTLDQCGFIEDLEAPYDPGGHGNCRQDRDPTGNWRC